MIMIRFLIVFYFVSIVMSIGDDFALPIVADFGSDFSVGGAQNTSYNGWNYGFVSRPIGAPIQSPSSYVVDTNPFRLLNDSAQPAAAAPPRWYLPAELINGGSGDFPSIGYGSDAYGMKYGYAHPALNDTLHYDAVVRFSVDATTLKTGLLCHFEYALANPACSDGVDILVYIERLTTCLCAFGLFVILNFRVLTFFSVCLFFFFRSRS
jgi:hypothetical protein